MAPAPRRPKYRFLDPDAREDIAAEAVPLDGIFQLVKPRFEPLSGVDVPRLEDGEKPTAVGRAAMEWWGRVNDKDWHNCPTDLVRAIEAVSATNDNVDRIRQAFKGTSASWERNHAGTYSAVTIDVLIPAVGPATVQPRESTAYGRLLRTNYRESLIHEIGDDLVILGDGADHFDHIRTMQYEAISPDFYHGERREFVDSLALEGIREPLRGFTYELATMDGQSGRYVETNDGYTRVAVAQQLMSKLLGGLPTNLSRLPWDNGDGTLQVRGWSAEKIDELFEALNFVEAPFEVWPEPATKSGIERWIHDASAAGEAVMRLMTARMSIGIKVRPYGRHSTHDVVYADMARFHVKGHQPAPWSRNDDESFKARTIVSNLARAGFIDKDERHVFLGSAEVPWEDDRARVPYRNRLVATVDTLVRLVVEDPQERERYPTVRQILKAMQVPNSPTQAVAAAASLAVQVAGLESSGEMGGFSAMVRRSFANALVRRLVEHEGDWTAQITEDVDVIVSRARTELASVLGTKRHAAYLGPNMRALALLAMVGHGMNPELTEYRRTRVNPDGSERIVRWPSSMTIVGRRRVAEASLQDPHVIVFHMARSPRGIDQLEAIVRAVTDHANPILPVDPHTGKPLLEDDLRLWWKNNPDLHGNSRGADIGSSTSEDSRSAGDSDADETSADVLGLSEVGAWSQAITTFRDELRGMAGKAEFLSRVPAGPDQLDIASEDWDPYDDSQPRMVDFVGVDDDTANGFNDDIDKIRKFFVDGVMAWFRRRSAS
jgi:hypothetical protein